MASETLERSLFSVWQDNPFLFADSVSGGPGESGNWFFSCLLLDVAEVLVRPGKILLAGLRVGRDSLMQMRRAIVVELDMPDSHMKLYIADAENMDRNYLGSGTILVADIMDRRCIPLHLPAYASRLQEMYVGSPNGSKPYECHHIAEWLNTFSTVDELFERAQDEATYGFEPEQRQKYLDYRKATEEEEDD